MERASLTIYSLDGPSPVLSLDVARSPSQQARGLMYVQKLPPNHGMLFVFPDEQPRSFWMRNTLVSLDQIFLDSAGYVVDVNECATPLSETSYVSKQPARYVVECPCGTVAMYDLRIGDGVHLEFYGS